MNVRAMSLSPSIGAVLGAVCLLVLSACHSSGRSEPAATLEAAPSIAGTVNAVVGGSRALSVPFTSNESTPLSNLTVTSGLSALPPGWSGPGTFTCASVANGNGCTLDLTFAPTGVTSGTLVIRYSYTDTAGLGHIGSVSVPYASTSNNNVMGSASPSGQVAAMMAGGSQVVTVTFDTDDGNSAASFAVTTDLTGLPAGWSSAAHSLNCAGVSTGNGCQLSLTFAPATAVSGTLTIDFGYVDNSGTAKTGIVSIPYAATSNDNVTGTAAPLGSVAPYVGQTQAVTVTFNTDDGNPASSLSVTSGLGALPAGWTGAGTFDCSTVSSGAGCQLTLTYSPTAVTASASIVLTFSYSDNAGASKTGSVNIPFSSAWAPHLYVGDQMGVWLCTIAGDSSLGGCAATGSLNGVTGIAFSGNFAYISEFDNNAVYVCAVAADGTGALSGCASTGSGFNSPVQAAVHGSSLYVPNANGGTYATVCTINATDGTLSDCAGTAGSASNPSSIAFNGSFAYVNNWAGNPSLCTLSGADLTNCAVTAGSLPGSWSLTPAGAYAYLGLNAPQSLGICSIAPDGTLTGCSTVTVGGTGPGDGAHIKQIALIGTKAYLGAQYLDMNTFQETDDIYVCSVSGATVSGCAASDGGASFNNIWSVAEH